MPTDQELLDAARQAYLDALATGKTVTFNGRSYTSHDLADLQAAIAALTVTTSTVRSRFASFSKGAPSFKTSE